MSLNRVRCFVGAAVVVSSAVLAPAQKLDVEELPKYQGPTPASSPTPSRSKSPNPMGMAGEFSEATESTASIPPMPSVPSEAQMEKWSQLADVVGLDEAVKELSAKEKYKEAIPKAEKKLAIYRKYYPESEPAANAMDELGTLYEKTGDDNKARVFYEDALRVREKVLNPDDINLALSLFNVGMVYAIHDKLDKAEPLLVRSLGIIEKVAGPQSPHLTPVLDILAHVYFKKHAYGKAEPLFLRVLDLREKSLGPEHPDTARTLWDLALLYKEMGDLAKGAPYYKRFEAIHNNASRDRFYETQTQDKQSPAPKTKKH